MIVEKIKKELKEKYTSRLQVKDLKFSLMDNKIYGNFSDKGFVKTNDGIKLIYYRIKKTYYYLLTKDTLELKLELLVADKEEHLSRLEQEMVQNKNVLIGILWVDIELDEDNDFIDIKNKENYPIEFYKGKQMFDII